MDIFENLMEQKKISWNLEEEIIKEINTNPPLCYERFNQKHLEKKFNIDSKIIESLFHITIKNKIFYNVDTFKSDEQLIEDYKKNSDPIQLSKKYDLAPLFLLNIIFTNKYKKNILYLNKNKHLLDDKDYRALTIGLKKDCFTLEKSFDIDLIQYKEFVKNFLFKSKINFVENSCWFDISSSDYILNGKKISWIGYANEYGSCIEKKYLDITKKNQSIINLIFNKPDDFGIIFYSFNICADLKIPNAIPIYLKNDNSLINISWNITSKQGDFYKFGLESKTDKITHHYYYKYYPIWLEKYRNIIANTNVKNTWAMIEIGIDHYRSLKLWEKYFPNTFIYGLDIGFEDQGKNFKIFKCDQSNLNDLTIISNKIIDSNKKIFFIIDDGSHHPDHQILTFNLFFDKLLGYGGCYIIEDIETSYWTKNDIYGYKTEFGLDNSKSFVSITKNFIDDVNGEFLNKTNRQKRNKNLNNIVPEHIRNLILSVSYGQNNIIIIKKSLEDLEINSRPYRFEENL